MEPSSALLLLALIVLVGMYLYAPLMSRSRRIDEGESHEISALQAERDRVINSLQELDFDHKLGKIPSGDYPEQRAALLQRGADILRRLDDLTPASAPGGNVKSRIERAAVAARGDSIPAGGEISDEDIESMIMARRKTQGSRSAGFCPKCGKPVLVTDYFCPACGKSLK